MSLLVLVAAAAPLRAENWYRVKSPHFTVVTNGSESDGRHLVGQMERLRAAFQAAFPNIRVDLVGPVDVLAIQGDRQFKSVEPVQYLARGTLRIAGYWMPGQGRNLMLLQIFPDERLQRPCAILYNGYAALLLSQGGQILPLWLRVGLADFYENSNLATQTVMLGRPDTNALELLRSRPPIPLAQLFADTARSKDYNDPGREPMFDAECWAMTHDLFFHRAPGKPAPLTAYIEQVNQNVDPVTAARNLFGAFDPLEDQLENYVHGLTMPYMKVNVSDRVSEKTFTAQKLTQPEADDYRAEVMVGTGRERDAEALLTTLLRANPNDVRAIEAEGWLTEQRSDSIGAEKWYAQAAALDPGNFLARFEYARLNMQSSTAAADRARDAADLREAIKLNPNFAPAYDRLAMLEMNAGDDLDGAHLLELHAVALDPGNYFYRLNTANILLAMNRPQGTIAVLKMAAPLARTDAELDEGQHLINAAETHEMELAAASPPVAAPPLNAAPPGAASAPAAPPPAVPGRSLPPVATQQATPQQEAAIAAMIERKPDAQVSKQASAGNLAAASNDALPANKKLLFSEPYHAPDLHGPKRIVTGVIAAVRCPQGADLALDIRTGAHSTVTVTAPDYFNIAYSARNVVPPANMNPCTYLAGHPAKVTAQAGQILAIELDR